ncbi:hypothetical protein G9A89_021178 [Geosiphon pyriformis]|nr:hypothetical protein G9A89_021178 [Geosiphon pyriformis]
MMRTFLDVFSPLLTVINKSATNRNGASQKKPLGPHEEDDCGFVFVRKRNLTTDFSASMGYIENPQSSNTQASQTWAEKSQTPEKPLKRSSPVLSHSKLTPEAKTPSRTLESIVAIPLAETPMIRKNQEIRKGRRRSSLEMRGKRTSTIGMGIMLKPHASLDPKEFYRHIKVELPGPHKMKQLLVWCGQRAIEKQKAKDENILKIAKIVEEEILNKMMNNQINTSWYNRKIIHDLNQDSPQKKQHPQNIENEKKLREYEDTLSRLKAEDQEWTDLIRNVNSYHASILDDCANLPPNKLMTSNPLDTTDISLLTEEERQYLENYCSKDKNLAEDQFAEETMTTIECEIDQFYQRLYNAYVFEEAAQIYCDSMLEKLRDALRKRQQGNIESSLEIKEVLRALTVKSCEVAQV